MPSSISWLLEPALIVLLLLGGTVANRRRRSGQSRISLESPRNDKSISDLEDALSSEDKDSIYANDAAPHSSDFSTNGLRDRQGWRTRNIGVFGWKRSIATPGTGQYQGYFMSRMLYRYPFLIEAWNWFLIYWIYQIARAIETLRINQSAVHLARNHAFQLISLERNLHIFHELNFQHTFLQYPNAIAFINITYSYVHIPATILFLIVLYHITITTPSTAAAFLHPPTISGSNPTQICLTGHALYQSRRRTLATANLTAFIIFTTWPLMPPRLRSDTSVTGPVGEKARALGFQDTVHGTGKGGGGGSIWTTNRFCNQWAAMPNLHFGYARLIGLTIMRVPLRTRVGRGLLGCWRRILCVGFGIGYPLLILVAVIATGNHLFLDVVGGGIVIALAWAGERILLNILPLEDWVLWVLRIHKPEEDNGNAVIKLERD